MGLGREPLAALGAAPPQHVPAGARAHAGTEPVGAGALALLGLVGPLHGDRNRRAGNARAPRAEGTRQGSRRPPVTFSRVMRGTLPGVRRAPVAPLYPRLAEGGAGPFSRSPSLFHASLR